MTPFKNICSLHSICILSFLLYSCMFSIFMGKMISIHVPLFHCYIFDVGNIFIIYPNVGKLVVAMFIIPLGYLSLPNVKKFVIFIFGILGILYMGNMFLQYPNWTKTHVCALALMNGAYGYLYNIILKFTPQENRKILLKYQLYTNMVISAILVYLPHTSFFFMLFLLVTIIFGFTATVLIPILEESTSVVSVAAKNKFSFLYFGLLVGRFGMTVASFSFFDRLLDSCIPISEVTSIVLNMYQFCPYLLGCVYIVNKRIFMGLILNNVLCGMILTLPANVIFYSLVTSVLYILLNTFAIDTSRYIVDHVPSCHIALFNIAYHVCRGFIGWILWIFFHQIKSCPYIVYALGITFTVYFLAIEYSSNLKNN